MTLKLSAVNEKGEPVPAVSYGRRRQQLSVVDDEVDERTPRPGSLPTHFLLTSEVQRPEELEHADVLLGDHPKAGRRAGPVAWHAGLAASRGAEDARDGVDARAPCSKRSALWEALAVRARTRRRRRRPIARPRMTAFCSPSASRTMFSRPTPSSWRRRTSVAAVRPEISAAQKQLEQALGAQAGSSSSDRTHAEEAAQLMRGGQQARSAVAQAQATLATTEEARQRMLGWLLPPALGLFLIVALVALVIGLWRGIRYQFAAAGALGMAAAVGLMLALYVGGVGEEKQMTVARAPRPKSAANADREGMAEDKIEQLQARKAQQQYAPMLRDQNGKAIAGPFAKAVQVMPNNFPLNSPPPQSAAPAVPGQAGGNLMAPRRAITFTPLPEIGSGVLVAENPDDIKAIREIVEYHLKQAQEQQERAAKAAS